MAFFYNLNRDAVMETIVSSSADSDSTATPPRLYEPVVAGDFLLMKHLASMGVQASAAP
jgi:hypothetical protein